MARTEEKPLDTGRKGRKIKLEKIRLGLLLKVSKKDWREIRGNKQIMLPMIVVPVVFAIVYPILMIGAPLSDPASVISPSFPTVFSYIAFMTSTVIKPLFVLIPLLITMAIASDSWAGEKERKTAESIFLLPLTDTELFTAKVLSSFIPGMLVTWGCAAGTMALIDVMAFPFYPAIYLPDWSWIFMLFVFTPIMSFFTIYINVWVSYRARDTKSAQQIGGSVIVVVLGVMVSSFLGVIDPVLYTLTAVFAVVDFILFYFAPRVFSRETMIARF